MEESEWQEGVVKWFSQEKVYGFIEMPGDHLDVFVHANKLRESGISDALKPGDKLRFKTVKGPKGLYAINISFVQ